MFTEPMDSTWHVAVRFTLSALAVYRVAFLIAREDGPWGMFRRLRAAVEGLGGRPPLQLCQLPERVDCAALAAFVGSSWVERVVAWWALSGAAVLADRATRDPFEVESGRADHHELLWRRRPCCHSSGRYRARPRIRGRVRGRTHGNSDWRGHRAAVYVLGMNRLQRVDPRDAERAVAPARVSAEAGHSADAS